MGAISLWQKELSLSEIPDCIPLAGILQGERLYQLFLRKVYGLYKKDWCTARSIRPEEVDEEIGVDGRCYVCLEEFEGCEFTDPLYMERLLAPEDFLIWKQFFLES